MHLIDLLESVCVMRGAVGLEPALVVTSDGETHELLQVEHSAGAVRLHVGYGFPEADELKSAVEEGGQVKVVNVEPTSRVLELLAAIKLEDCDDDRQRREYLAEVWSDLLDAAE